MPSLHLPTTHKPTPQNFKRAGIDTQCPLKAVCHHVIEAMEADNSSAKTSNTGNSSIGDIGTPERVEVRSCFIPAMQLSFFSVAGYSAIKCHYEFCKVSFGKFQITYTVL